MTNELKNQLKNCQIHNEVFCAWCDECEKNICQICLGKEFKERHNYILFNNLIEDCKEENFTIKIEYLKNFLKEIKLYYSGIIDYEDDIKNLELLIMNNENICDLYFKENIINLQILKNLKLIYDDNNYEKYLSLINNKYSVFSSFIKGKNVNEVKVKNIIKFPKDFIVSEVLLLNSKLYDDHDDNEGNEMKILVLLKSLNTSKFFIYDIDGNLINSINLNILYTNSAI